jgi:hypothetical protein
VADIVKGLVAKHVVRLLKTRFTFIFLYRLNSVYSHVLIIRFDIQNGKLGAF